MMILVRPDVKISDTDIDQKRRCGATEQAVGLEQIRVMKKLMM